MDEICPDFFPVGKKILNIGQFKLLLVLEFIIQCKINLIKYFEFFVKNYFYINYKNYYYIEC